MIPNGSVEIVEVGPRDGLQNLEQYVETGKKLQLINFLTQSGLKEIQVGGFVHPKAIPQFRDMKEVVRELPPVRGIKFTSLVPNLRGAKDALESGIRKIIFVFSVSRSHNLSNVRRTPEESLEELRNIKELLCSYPDVEISVDLATTFGCPFEIQVKKDDIMHCVKKVFDLGIKQMTLCDTVGFANPRQVEDIISTCIKSNPEVTFRVHFHNTRGLGLANALAAYESGIRSFDSSIGGLGGCPFAPGASGNVATEDQVFMFNEMGIETGVDIHSLFEASRYLEEILGDVRLTSSVFKAGLPGETRESGFQ